MKKLLFFLSALSLLMVGACSGGDEDPQPVTPVCSAPVTGLTVTQNNDLLNINITAGAGALYYEVSRTSAGSGIDTPDNGQVSTLESASGSISAFPEGSSLFYARTVCADGTRGNWFGPVLRTVQPFCNTPVISSVSIIGVDWSFVSGVTTYQLQYGPAGFTMGTGTIVNVDNDYYGDMSMAAGQAYDFYVRAYCPVSSGYGNWSPKYTYLSESNVNMCLAPTNVNVVYNSSTSVSFEFNPNGEDKWEYTLVGTGASPTSGTIYTLNTFGYPTYTISFGVHRDFYIRTVCNDNSRTGWVKASF
jgi:hypothetical protein